MGRLYEIICDGWEDVLSSVIYTLSALFVLIVAMLTGISNVIASGNVFIVFGVMAGTVLLWWAWTGFWFGISK